MMTKASRIARRGAVVVLPMLFVGMITAQSAGNWTLQIPSTSPSVRRFHAMAYDSVHGQTVLFGGADSVDTFGDTWVSNGSNWTQKSPQNTPPARSNHTMAYDSAHGQIIMFGGFDAGGNLLNDLGEGVARDFGGNQVVEL